ncbi:MAG TPA: DNA repair protein RecO [Gammaproteobacteria bacterium]|nr:DNA repair protein RecO [Gammaproteobacteria bacterium]
MSERREARLVPAWVLHSYPYRETSLIVEALSRDHGRIGLVARGARRNARGSLRPAPFAPLLLSFRQHGELATLSGCEADGAPYRFGGDAFLAACYLNELLLRLLPRDDPAPEVYAIYTEALAALAPVPAPAVRRFEGRLLRILGWAPPWGRDASGAVLDSARRYRYDPRRGPVPVAREEEGFGADMFEAIAAERFEEPEVLAAAAKIFREIIAYHLGGKRLKTLEVARSLSRGNERSSAA